MDEIVARLALNSKRLSVMTTNGEEQVVISDLVFIESFRHQMLLHFADGATLETKQYTLSELSELLVPHAFLCIVDV